MIQVYDSGQIGVGRPFGLGWRVEACRGTAGRIGGNRNVGQHYHGAAVLFLAQNDADTGG